MGENKRKVAIIPGDGIGEEITKATLAILNAVGFEAEWIYLEAGLGAIESGKSAVPEETINVIRETGIALKGPTTTPSGTGHSSANVTPAPNPRFVRQRSTNSYRARHRRSVRRQEHRHHHRA